MQTANNKTTKHSLRALMPALTLLLMALFSQAAQALLLQIDPTQSEIRSVPSSIQFCWIDPSGEEVCPPLPQPQTFPVTGSVDVNVIHEHLDFGAAYPVVDRDLLYLKALGLSSDALGQGFYLGNTVVALLDGETFEAQNGGCFLFVGPGSCSGWDFFLAGSSEGTWNGHTLTWNGNTTQYFNILNFQMVDAFEYTIVARAVPEPGTISLMLLVLPLMFFGLTRKNHGVFALREVKR